MARDEVYVRHMLDAINTIASFLDCVDQLLFMEDVLVQSAVIRQIEIIGEAARNISDTFRARHDDVPWSDVIGMRNKLIHEYFGVDLEAVWKTAQEDIPQLQRQLA